MAWVMSTLGFGVILQSIGLAIWGPKPVVVPGPVGDAVIRFGDIGVRPQELLMLGVAVVIMIGFDRVMNRTMVGKAMRAVAANGNVASLMGINTNAVMIGAFVVSSALAGLSGFLLAPIAQASLFMGLTVGLKGFSGAMIGGLSNPRGCVIGGFAARRPRVAGQPLAGAMARGRGVRPRHPGAWRSGRPACSASKMVEKV